MKLMFDFKKISPDIKIILSNMSWLFFDKIFRIGFGFVLTFVLARRLGPSLFGKLNFALAYVSIFTAISSMGLNGIVVREVLQNPKDEGKVLGSASILQLIGGIFATFISIITIFFLRKNDNNLTTIIIILSFINIFKLSDVIKMWYEAKLKSKNTIIIENTVFVIFSIIKIILIINGFNLTTIIWMYFFESAFTCLGIIFNYKLTYSFVNWSFSKKIILKLFNDSMPLLFSGIAIMIYMRIDQIMLGKILGDNEVGIYSSALKISEMWYMIPMVIVASLKPSIIESQKKGEDEYLNIINKILNFLATFAILLAVFISIFSSSIIRIFYGEAYTSASTILLIHVWTNVFVFIGIGGEGWYITQNYQKISFYRTITGALINIILNILLIPLMGVNGAAFATLISQAMASYFFDFISKKSKVLFYIKTNAIFFWPIFLIQKFFKE